MIGFQSVARRLLYRLKADHLVLDWRKQQVRARVRQAIRKDLDESPAVFTTPAYEQSVTAVCAHVYESYRS
ncbi:hypothetical protein FNU79_17140 [Deinococcus detaillensis]|uniref:Uncharacterized protein n=1 Tax=Deinococcus detaillensis TaxID=2592048 RepID=A0A553UIB6_9DEIO|nr:hypothetical protein [Deinococcus detaillensis]TSA79964.1 hypothetical protein FNU79_17140 [Deinococcus detaillensis]